MPSLKREIDLSTASRQKVLDAGGVALGLVISFVTPGVRYFVYMGTKGDPIGPVEGRGYEIVNVEFGPGLPLADRNTGIWVQAVNPQPGATMIVDASFGEPAV